MAPFNNFKTLLMFQYREGFAAGAQKAVTTIQPVVDLVPHFITKPRNFSIVRGDTIRLPCHAVNTGSYIQAWKRGIAVISAGKVKISPDPRIQLLDNDYDLEIKKVNTNDTGEYICHVAAVEPTEITHSLLVKVPPIIEKVTSGGLVEVKKGSKIILECQTSGIPPPTITWTRRNNLVVAGAKSITGSSLAINQTTRHHAGVYMCTADNGVPPSVTEEIIVNILYPPEIEVEKLQVYTGIGLEAQLVCIIQAHPAAYVRWYTDSMRLENTERMRMENRGSRYTLIIRDVVEADLITYTCQADNSQGKTKKDIVLSGMPHPMQFRSQKSSEEKDSFNISWSVISYSPIESYRLYYRKADGGEQLYSSPPTRKTPKKYNQWPFSLKDNSWTQILIPVDEKEESQIHEGHFIIRGLEPKTEYEVKAQAENKFGWSNLTDIFKFKTKDCITVDLTPEPAYQNSREARPPKHLEATAGCAQIYLFFCTLIFPTILLILNII